MSCPVLPRLHNSSLPSPADWHQPDTGERDDREEGGDREGDIKGQERRGEREGGSEKGASLADAMQRQYDANATQCSGAGIGIADETGQGHPREGCYSKPPGAKVMVFEMHR